MKKYDVVIIGAGTAGLTAAIYVRRANKTALVLEGQSYGGQIVNAPEIENYPGIKHISGFDFANGLYEQATELGAEIEYEQVTGIEVQDDKRIVHTTSGDYEAGAVVIAAGAKKRALGLEREDEFTGRGVSYCATCDGMFFRGKDVAVVGGGNVAIKDALYLSGIVNHVYVIHRGNQLHGNNADIDNLKSKSNVEIIYNTNVTGFVGEDVITGVEVVDKASGEQRTIPVSAVFVAVMSRDPDNKPFANVVDLDEKGYIVAGEDCKTKTPGIFVAGDCRAKGLRQLATAAGDGAVAGNAAVAFLR